MFKEERKRRIWISLSLLAMTLCVVGCRSPYHADQGALTGGLLGAGAGAIIGDATGGNAGTGAAIGAGLGALTGAVVGSEMDEMEARNRAMIEEQYGRQLAAGATTIDEVINMSNAGVDDTLIVNHIKANGMAAPLSSNDLIMLKQSGVSEPVIAAMQAPPVAKPVPVATATQAQPVIVEEHYYGGPYMVGPPRRFYRHHPPHPGVTWGVTVH
ncbi:MAG: glycine zipper domain-containing protein [Planctomycetia bacterium]|jgi:hypothetical protein